MKLKTCPKCGSADIGADGFLSVTGSRYKCKNCGYAGDIILERDVEKDFSGT